MTIPLARPSLGPEEFAAVQSVLASGQVTQGSEVAHFEQEFIEQVGTIHAAAVSSGTAALHLALLAAGVGSGDEVIVPAFTFAATANAVALAGATPVFADVDENTFCLDPESVLSLVSPRTAAIIAVHLFGHIAPMKELRSISDKYSLLLVEDAAQAHGAALDGVGAGALGDVAAFSFYATKNMTTGEGGMVTTRDAAVDRRVRLLRNQGMLERYRNEVVGFNARMTDIAAAIGRVQLSRLADLNARRRTNADRYQAALTSVSLPRALPGHEHVFHQFTVRTPNRDELQGRLALNSIGTGVFYPVPVHRLPAFGLTSLSLPKTEDLCNTVLSIPVGPHVNPEDVDRICEVIESA